MEKIAVITDIHGNSPALEAVLLEIALKGVNRIYCLGDVVGIGPDSNQVLESLLSRNDISFVVGNHDLAVIAAFMGGEPPPGHQNEREHHQWLADRIDPAYINRMSNWPKQIIIEKPQKVLFTHYHLNETKWFLPIEKNPTIENLDQIYQNQPYKLVCFGHHHVVHHVRSDSRVYFNPGSLGCYHKPYARYGILTLTEHSMSEEVVEVPYDNSEFLKSYDRLKVPEREFIMRVFHGGQLK